MSEFIRPATKEDASRITEIMLFTKRVKYRDIFHDDIVSFVEMQALPIALNYRDNDSARKGIILYDDGIVKAMARSTPTENGLEINEVYVDYFFEGQGIGTKLMKHLLEDVSHAELWVLEKNTAARAFYEHKGFRYNGVKKLEPDTPEYLLRYVYDK